MDMEQRVEQRAKAVEALAGAKCFWSDKYRRIARAELEREGRLVAELRRAVSAMDCCVSCTGGKLHDITVPAIREALAAYEAEFAPPQRTVEQVQRDAVRLWNMGGARDWGAFAAFMDELAAALGKDGK